MRPAFLCTPASVSRTNSASVIVALDGGNAHRPKVPDECAPPSIEVVGAVRHLDAHVRPLTSLTREEVAELARNAADNAVPLHEGIVFEPGTWQSQLFSLEWAARHRELAEGSA